MIRFHIKRKRSVPNCVDGWLYFSLWFLTSVNNSLILPGAQICASGNVGVGVVGLGEF